MNRFDITKARPQWLVALLALLFAMALATTGCVGNGADEGDAQGESATEQAAQAAEDEGPLEAGEAAEDIVVPVSITMPAGFEGEPKTIDVTVPAGATVFEVLEATGWDVQAENSEYGKYVTAINGAENGSQGEASGWIYTVNDQEVMEACDARVLEAGDSVQWSFYVG